MTFASLLRKLALVVLLCVSTQANATLTYTCFYTTPLQSGVSNPSIPWFPSGATVDIWYTNYNDMVVGDLRPWMSMGITEAQFQEIAIKAVGVWNEQSGAKIRLRYRGVAPYYKNDDPHLQCTSGVCSVVLMGDTLCDSALNAESFIWLDSSHKFKIGIIKFHQTNTNQLPPPCGSAIQWSGTTSSATDDGVRDLIHELGHTVFSMAHLDGTTTDCNDHDSHGNPILSVMEINYALPDKRNLKTWDKEVAQLRYGSRSASAVMDKAVPLSTGWRAVQVTGTSATRLLYRDFSMTEALLQRVIGWIDGGGTVQTFGTGSMNVSNYAAGLVSSGPLGYSNSPEPIAIASQPQSYTNPMVLYAYKTLTSGHEYSNDQNTICWKISIDNGVHWPLSPTCSSYYSSVHGLTAAWNEAAQAFVVAFVDTGSAGYKVSVLAISTGGTVVRTNLLNSGTQIWTPTTPGIACQASGNTCLLAYAVDDNNGSLGWFTVTVNTSTLVASAGSISTWGVTIDDVPGLAWDIDDSTYRLAKSEKASAIYSYSKTTSASSWTGTGDIYNNSGGLTQISGAALSTRPILGLSSRVYAWFSQYF
jgi:hypothetical protein